jgi:beta-phosphoglucomutase-like phosphatase (HAD superfamily)
MIPSHLKLVIFDLDDTLHSVVNNCMDDNIISILNYFKFHNISIALATLNKEGDKVLDFYKIKHYFDFIEMRKELYMCIGIQELDEILRLLIKAQVNPENAIFFDDNIFHVNEAKSLGIKGIHVDKNKRISWRDVINGMNMFT